MRVTVRVRVRVRIRVRVRVRVKVNHADARTLHTTRAAVAASAVSAVGDASFAIAPVVATAPTACAPSPLAIDANGL